MGTVILAEEFGHRAARHLGEPVRAAGLDILQVNMGYLCNMSCKHCHVQAGPGRAEVMSPDTVDAVLAVLRDNPMPVLDITGGAPEMNPSFGRLAAGARAMGRHVTVRSNLTILTERGYEDMPEFFAEQGLEVVASLPNYIKAGVDRVRSAGTFDRSVEALRRLNALGYGREGSGLVLNLVYNPPGAFLPPAQAGLQDDYRRSLGEQFGIEFNSLYTFTNMPIGRFRDFLVRSGNLDKYMERLACAFNPATLKGLMCRCLISVRWDGGLYDCDFNQVLGLALEAGQPGGHIGEFDYEGLCNRRIAVAEHCYACTAGAGST